jgi:hypothetical protein
MCVDSAQSIGKNQGADRAHGHSSGPGALAEGELMNVQLHEASGIVFKIDETRATCVIFPPEGLEIDVALSRIQNALATLRNATLAEREVSGLQG